MACKLKKKSYFQRSNVKEAISGYLFVLPNLIGFLIFTLFGISFTLFMSFTDWNLVKDFNTLKFVGFDNYINLFKDEWFLSSISNNLWFLCMIPFQIFFALIVANLLNSKVLGRAPVRTMFFLPYVTNIVAVSVVWAALFHPRFSPINQFLMGLGVEHTPLWFADVNWAKPAVAIVILWQQIGYHSLIYLASLQSISADLYEAARIDGANRVQTFFRITVPMVSPTTFMIVILCMIFNFQSWTIIQVLTDGGPGTASYNIAFFIFKKAFVNFQMGYGSAAGIILFLIAIIAIVIQFKGQKKWVNE